MSDKTQLLLLALIFFLIGVAAGRSQVRSTTVSKVASTLFNEETVEWTDRHGVKRSLTIKRKVHEE